MVLAAGLATRMRPITDSVPKALVPVAGKPIIDHAIDRLAAVGVKRVVVNLHYRGDMIARHLEGRRDVEIVLSPEAELLDSGGGVVNALPHLGEAFYVINADVFWLNGKVPALIRIARAFDGATMDGILLMQRTVTAVGLDGPGDFMVDPVGLLRWRGETEIAPHYFAAIQLLHRRFFAGAPGGKFSIKPYWTRAILAERLYGIVHEGEWYHLETPRGLAAVEQRLATRSIER
ncbi:MAG TPA: nucleotidyltransferase family protein [Stellaceae bacterium]|nr:nucleotidyltransferase family protein [Stellaceae bacterium]